MAASYRFNASGRVQGVGFRYAAVQVAHELGLTGWVRNREDGSVEGLAQGDEPALEKFQDWLRRGPPAAAVQDLSWTATEIQPLDGFETRR